LETEFTPEKLGKAINGNLWRDIRIMNVEIVHDEFHARFAAKQKTYVYRVINAPVMSPFWRRFAHHESRPLDVPRMNDAARLFLGRHDWTAFASAQSDSEDKVRDIRELNVTSAWDDRAKAALLEFRVSADGFLRYMVRSIVGGLLEVGRAEKSLEDVETAIVSADRKFAPPTASAKGLTLLKVNYE
jgi:tRNA pseudouridine38-40 synthase